ncbi:YkgJ family cysteine cluster protein [Methanolobus halotolerans]|uniref:Fe-S oxidoreductase n=1 Tax=Methanolobus halotolerans TaxID=2052935 RepID=A0A4E0PZ40_9EURY|nr:YkgJ family cysteine cluster protein [Methanolobus halotolerans]TGC10913.1 Fe-S oxidoreductase [Methanolobus halotolerans]
MQLSQKELVSFKTSIDEQLSLARLELKELQDYPDEDLIATIKEVGFHCDLCARCCTQEFNDHVFLLEEDADIIRQIDPTKMEPAPYYELCDQKGNFYVSGYALKTKEDGSCTFLEGRRCTIYDRRPSICRLYPYMLHLEADEEGNVGWRQISGLNLHGCYHNDIRDEECKTIASDVKAYESSFLEQKIAFLEKARQHFTDKKLRHVQGVYDREMRRFNKGGNITVFVFYGKGFKDHEVKTE